MKNVPQIHIVGQKRQGEKAKGAEKVIAAAILHRFEVQKADLIAFYTKRCSGVR